MNKGKEEAMNREKVIRIGIIAGICLLAVLGLVIIGAPMAGMIRAHLGF